jgi:hypothetical protein
MLADAVFTGAVRTDAVCTDAVFTDAVFTDALSLTWRSGRVSLPGIDQQQRARGSSS